MICAGFRSCCQQGTRVTAGSALAASPAMRGRRAQRACGRHKACGAPPPSLPRAALPAGAAVLRPREPRFRHADGRRSSVIRTAGSGRWRERPLSSSGSRSSGLRQDGGAVLVEEALPGIVFSCQLCKQSYAKAVFSSKHGLGGRTVLWIPRPYRGA